MKHGAQVTATTTGPTAPKSKFTKGDRVRRTTAWLIVKWRGKRREQAYGTVAHTPRNDFAVLVHWDGRVKADSWSQLHVEKF